MMDFVQVKSHINHVHVYICLHLYTLSKPFFLYWKVYVDGGGDTEMGEFVQCSEYTILKLKITRF